MGLDIFYSGALELDKLKISKNSLKKLYNVARKGYFYTVTKSNYMTQTSTAAAFATPTANNDQYVLSAYIVVKELRNRGWLNLGHTIYSRYSAFFVNGGTFPKDLTLTGAEFRQYLISYCQANPLSLDAIADNGDGFLKIMVEACEMQKSTWNLL